MATQDRRDRAGRDPELGPDPVLPSSFIAAQPENLLLDLGRSAPGTPPWARRAIDQAGITLSPEPSNPAMRALPGNTELLGDMSDRTTVLDHPLNKQATAVHIQTSISVGHEDLLVSRDVRHLHSIGRFLLSPAQNRHQRPRRVHLGAERLAPVVAVVGLEQPPRAQGQVQLGLGAEVTEIQAGQLLHLPDAVHQGLLVDPERA